MTGGMFDGLKWYDWLLVALAILASLPAMLCVGGRKLLRRARLRFFP